MFLPTAYNRVNSEGIEEKTLQTKDYCIHGPLFAQDMAQWKSCVTSRL